MEESISKERVAELLGNLFKIEPSKSKFLSDYCEAAAVLEYFSFNEIRPVKGKKNRKHALECLYDISKVVYDENRQPQRSLTDSVRRETLEGLYRKDGTTGFQRALASNPVRPGTRLQRLFENYLNGETPKIEEQSRPQMLCLAQISNWLFGILENVPDPVVVSRKVASESLLAPFKFLLNVSAENPRGSFFGRQKEIDKLYDYVEIFEASTSTRKIVREAREILDFRKKPPLAIYAPGGTGKSTLLAKFVLDHAKYGSSKNVDESEEINRDRFPFVYLDFDNPSLNPAEPLTLLLEGIQQLSIQYPEHSSLLLGMRDDWLSAMRRADRSPTKQERLAPVIEDRAPFIKAFGDVINNQVNKNNAPLLFLIDTFEEAQWRSLGYVEGILKFLADLQELVPRLRTIISGRTEVQSTTYSIENFPLPPFDPPAAQKFLQKNGVEDPSIANAIVAQLGGSPLTLRLAAALYKLEEVGQEGITDIKTKQSFLSKLKDEGIQAQLYKRILEHIHTEEVRDLAHPGLVLRRITAELIYEVLAKPCGIDVPDLTAAQTLFEKLKKEVALVNAEDNSVLVHRRDLRTLMLKLLNEDKKVKVKEIHQNAIKFYSQFEDDTSRTEEIYHRLSLDFDRTELDSRWRSNLQFKRDDIGELPPRSQGYLAARLQVNVEADIWDKADFEDWERYAVRTARDLINADNPADALVLVHRREGWRDSREILGIEREIEIKQKRQREVKGQSFTSARLRKMSEWYAPATIARTFINSIVSTFVGSRSLIASVSPTPETFFDYSKGLIRTIDDFKPAEDIHTRGIWIDYVADLGDGWNSTYSVAYNLAKPRLEAGEQSLNRGEIMIFGGDPIYPDSTMGQYMDRLIVPYQMAFKARGEKDQGRSRSDVVDLRDEPHIFALPGYRDWEDNLSNFKKIFCSAYYYNRVFAGGWKTRQKQSYFALKLPHNWWMLGFDIELGRQLDENQLQYFESVCENMKASDRVILCTQDSYWVHAIKNRGTKNYYERAGLSLERIEDFLARRGIEIKAYLAGGIHHYRRFENDTGAQRITAGGGGAFLQPTHEFDFRDAEELDQTDGYKLKTEYPKRFWSRKYDWRLLYEFFRKNPTFGHLTGFGYAILAWLIQGEMIGVFTWKKAFFSTVNGLLAQPLATFCLISIIAFFMLFTDSRSKFFKIYAGLTHALANLAAIFFTSWQGFLLSQWLIMEYRIPLDYENMVNIGCILATAYLGGYIFGSLIMSVYLFISLHFFSKHDQEAFSALKIEDYKNFLRLHIDESGDLTIYPFKIEKVSRNWSPIYGYYEPTKLEPEMVPGLIEDPIVLKT